MKMSRARPPKEIGSFIWEDTVRSWVLVQKKAQKLVVIVVLLVLGAALVAARRRAARRALERERQEDRASAHRDEAESLAAKANDLSGQQRIKQAQSAEAAAEADRPHEQARRHGRTADLIEEDL
jgi:flagellar biosynthesis/type III secretory pathway M-ring protein FliF/YscJ